MGTLATPIAGIAGGSIGGQLLDSWVLRQRGGLEVGSKLGELGVSPVGVSVVGN